MSIAHAQRGKVKRSAALAKLASGQLSLRNVLRDGHKSLGTCPVYAVVLAPHSMGVRSTRRVFEQAKVWPLTPLDELSGLERQALIDKLPGRIK